MIYLRKYRYVILCAILCILAALFIFSNSCKNGEESNAISSGLAESILALFNGNGNIDTASFHKFIRKTAHFTEFAVLGAFLTLLMFSVEKITGRYHVSAIFLSALITAVTDEFIQNFTGRSSMVSDVLIDFSGAVTGILLAVLIVWQIRRSRKKKCVSEPIP
ncbi:MAG: VanZ family protein [Clostridia bacterium]|nr:VanZ family protein [Clostridia bacterium]